MEFTRRKIKVPRALGEILKGARKKKELTLEQAEEETKVRTRYLEALEESHYEQLPSSVYAVGFLAKYAELLDLDKNVLIKQFNEERGIDGKYAKIMVERRIKEPIFSITPRFFVIAGISLALLGILGYIAFSVHQFTSPPNLEISSPSAEQVIKEDKVEIIGKTDEGSTVMINGQSIITDDRGNFHQEVKLHAGLNSFEISSINQLKKENVKLVKVLADIAAGPSPEPSDLVAPLVSPMVSPSIKITPTPNPSVSSNNSNQTKP